MAVTQEKAFETSREVILSPDERTAAFIAKMKNRTPEEIEEARAQMTKGFPPPRPLPPGKTLEDVIVGALPDDEDDAVILAAIEDMDLKQYASTNQAYYVHCF